MFFVAKASFIMQTSLKSELFGLRDFNSPILNHARKTFSILMRERFAGVLPIRRSLIVSLELKIAVRAAIVAFYFSLAWLLL
jgi:hypothetical protein